MTNSIIPVLPHLGDNFVDYWDPAMTSPSGWFSIFSLTRMHLPHAETWLVWRIVNAAVQSLDEFRYLVRCTTHCCRLIESLMTNSIIPVLPHLGDNFVDYWDSNVHCLHVAYLVLFLLWQPRSSGTGSNSVSSTICFRRCNDCYMEGWKRSGACSFCCTIYCCLLTESLMTNSIIPVLPHLGDNFVDYWDSNVYMALSFTAIHRHAHTHQQLYRTCRVLQRMQGFLAPLFERLVPVVALDIILRW